jgi:hypothetical protein
MEIKDSVFQYVEFEQYTGPTVPFRYTIKGDSFLLKSDETSSKDRCIIYKLDYSTMWLTDQSGTTIFQKINLDLALRTYTDSLDLEYANQFFALKKKYKCL